MRWLGWPFLYFCLTFPGKIHLYWHYHSPVDRLSYPPFGIYLTDDRLLLVVVATTTSNNPAVEAMLNLFINLTFAVKLKLSINLTVAVTSPLPSTSTVANDSLWIRQLSEAETKLKLMTLIPPK